MEKEKKQKSVKDVFTEAISGADSKPRGKWVLAKDLTCTAADPPPPPRRPAGKKDEPETSSIWRTIAAGAGVAAGVALLGYELWNLAYPEPDPEPGTRDKGKKMMKQPGNRPLWMPRPDFEENPKDYFRKLRGK